MHKSFRKIFNKVLENWPVFIIVGLIFLTYRVWIFSFGIITSGDWLYFFKESTIDHFWGYLYLWRPSTGLGGLILDIGQAPSYLLVGFYAKYFHLEYWLIERLVYLYPIVILTPLSIYLVLQKFYRHKIAILIGAIFFTFNTYFLMSDTGHVTLMAAVPFIPVTFYFFDQAISKLRFDYCMITALSAALCAYYEPRMFYILAIILFFYFIFKLIVDYKFYLLNWKRLFIFIITFGLVELLLNIYWIIGLASTSSLTDNALGTRSLFGGNFWLLEYSITAYHPWWSGDKIIPFINNKIPWYQWVIPLLAIVGFFLGRKKKHVVFFGLLAIIGIFLSKQTSAPLPFVYPWLYENVPGFNMFREASKFYFIVVFAYSILIVNFISWFLDLNIRTNKTKSVILKSIFISLLILLTSWHIIPMVSGRIDTLFRVRHIPEDYQKLKGFLANQDEYSRVLWVPADSRWSYYSNNHPKVSLIGMLSDLSRLSNYNPDIAKYPFEQQSVALLKKTYSEQLLDISSIKYLIVPVEDVTNGEDMFESYGPKESYISSLDSLGYLTKIDIKTKDVVVYQSRSNHPHIYLTDQVQTLDNNIPYEEIIINDSSPTEYKLSIKNVRDSFYLNFAEKYHPDWKLGAGNFNWLDSIRDKTYSLPDGNHFESDLGLNYFYVDINDLKDTELVHQNTDGTYDLDLTLYFKPQIYYSVGIIISLLSVVISLVALLYYRWKISKKGML